LNEIQVVSTCIYGPVSPYNIYKYYIALIQTIKQLDVFDSLVDITELLFF